MIDTHAIRCSIIRLALTGALTERRDSDGNATDLLDLLGIHAAVIDEQPYQLPETWAWVRLSDLYEVNPRVIANDDDDAAFVPMERVCAGFRDAFTYEIQKWSKASRNHTRFQDGDVAFAKISPSFENRKAFIACDLPNGIGGGTTELIILRQPAMYARFTYYVVLDQRFIQAGSEQFRGIVGQQRVKPAVVKQYLVPVPPYDEQVRIVERIEQAFSSLDAIDELQGQYASNMATIEGKIVDAGLQGALTEKWREEHNIDLDDWTLTTIDGCFDVVGGIQKKPIRAPKDNPVPYITVANVFRNRLELDNLKCFELFEGELERLQLQDKDILVVEGNGSGNEIGRCAMWRNQVLICVHQNHIIRLRCIDDQVMPEYVLLYLNSPMGQAVVKDRAKTTTGLYNLSAGKIRTIPITLPTIDEQRVIVDMVDELLAALPE